MLYTLNLHSAICQLYCKKAERKNNPKISKNIPLKYYFYLFKNISFQKNFGMKSRNFSNKCKLREFTANRPAKKEIYSKRFQQATGK